MNLWDTLKFTFLKNDEKIKSIFKKNIPKVSEINPIVF